MARLMSSTLSPVQSRARRLVSVNLKLSCGNPKISVGLVLVGFEDKAPLQIAMESTIVDGLTIRAWEGAICEHSKQSLAPLHAPLRDLSEPNGLPSLCTAIELVEGQRDREGADSEAQSAAAKRTLMAASSVAAESSAQYVGQVSQWSHEFAVCLALSPYHTHARTHTHTQVCPLSAPNCSDPAQL